MKILSFAFLCVIANAAMAQNVEIPRDTSFTIQSAYIKAKKQYPFIKIGNPPISKSIKKTDGIIYKTIGDRSLSLTIFSPNRKVKGGSSAVLMIHGGGWRSGDKTMCYPQAIKLAESGFVAIAVEYRLSLEAKYPAAVEDLKEAIRWLRLNADKYHINPNQIAALGYSSGGQIAALLGTTNGDTKFSVGKHLEISDDIQAVINIDGVSALHHPESSEGSAAEFWLGGTSAEIPAIWEEAAALTYANQKSAPVLFINSSLPRFHAGRDDMIKTLNTYHIYSEVHEFPNTPHPFWLFDPWFQPTIDFTVNFLNKVFPRK